MLNLVRTSPEGTGWVPRPYAALLSTRFVQLDLFFSRFPVFWRARSASIDLTIRASAVFLSVGSSKPHLQKEVVAIYNLCHEAGIHFSAEWIPCHFNFKADYWSKVVDTDDWMLNPVHFCQLDILWGPHTVDHFASHNSFQLPRFCSRWWYPGSETVDAFTVS